jgi:hypothetical protein
MDLHCVAVMIAASISGFIAPQIMRHMLRDAPANAHEWQVVISGMFQINQGMSQVFGRSIDCDHPVVGMCASHGRIEPLVSDLWMLLCRLNHCCHFLRSLKT